MHEILSKNLSKNPKNIQNLGDYQIYVWKSKVLLENQNYIQKSELKNLKKYG